MALADLCLTKFAKGLLNEINKLGHAFSRIHVDDIASILAASISRPNPGAIYNVCDNEPAAPSEITEYACHLLEKDPPPIEDFEVAKERMTPMGLSFLDRQSARQKHTNSKRAWRKVKVSRLPFWIAGYFCCGRLTILRFSK